MKSTIPLLLIDSTNIAGIGYDFATAALAVKFKSGPGGTTYHYAGVPAWLYHDLCNAKSIGKFFAEKIKDAKDDKGEYRYPHTLMKPEDDEDGDVPVEPSSPKDPPQDPSKKIEEPKHEVA